ncbi:hypothetical protein EYF80_014510 [Liparis tanakae]|uniref:Uncharacterized protein n=1 Tax=Liparis tanakae TaxID=230148 RepID=A0A4Z2IE42_9TELE|nr:hypothetical protein EYF80_014510 [Liparis tanakae]
MSTRPWRGVSSEPQWKSLHSAHRAAAAATYEASLSANKHRGMRYFSARTSEPRVRDLGGAPFTPSSSMGKFNTTALEGSPRQ